MNLDHWRIELEGKTHVKFTRWILGEEPVSFIAPHNWLVHTMKQYRRSKKLDQQLAYQELYRYIARLGSPRQRKIMQIKHAN